MIMSPGDQVLVTAVILVMVALAGFFLAAAAEYARAARRSAEKAHELSNLHATFFLDNALVPPGPPSHCGHTRPVRVVAAHGDVTVALACLDCRGWLPPDAGPSAPPGSPPPWDDVPPPEETGTDGTVPLDMRDVL